MQMKVEVLQNEGAAKNIVASTEMLNSVTPNPYLHQDEETQSLGCTAGDNCYLHSAIVLSAEWLW